MITSFKGHNKHYQSLRRNQVFDKIENAKVGDILPESDIYNYIEYLHEEEDFSEGDIVSRIEQYKEYQLTKVPIDEIDIDEWGWDEDVVDNYKELYHQTKKYPSIVLEELEPGIQHSIIDGTHRVNALDELGIKTVLAWVGIRLRNK